VRELTDLVMFLRAILKRAVKKGLVRSNPAEDLKARSKKKSSEPWHSSEACAALYSVVSGRDHLAIRILVELRLRSEELFALRRNDVRAEELVIDEAIPNGRVKEPKTEASAASVFIPPDLGIEMTPYLETNRHKPIGVVVPVNPAGRADAGRKRSPARSEAGGDQGRHRRHKGPQGE
jgi:integrase